MSESKKRIIKSNRSMISLYLSLGFIISFLTNFTVYYFQKIIDGLSAKTLAFNTIIIYSIILFLKYILNYFDQYPSKKLENSIYLDFKLFALEKIEKIQYSVYQKLGTGKLVQRIENGAASGKSILFDFYFRLVRELIPKVIFSIYFIWNINHLVTYFIIAGYFVMFISTNLLLRLLYCWKEKILLHEEELNHYLLRGIMELIIFRIAGRYSKEIEKASKAKNIIVDSKVKITLIHESFFAIFAVLMAIVEIGVIVFAWKNQSISIGGTVALIGLINHAYTPIAIFNVLFVQYKLNALSYNRFQDFLMAPEDIYLKSGKRVNDICGNICINNLNFYYENYKILNNLNLKIHAGEKVALVGKSGCGKSTLIKLILGLLKYEKGEILIDNQKLSEMRLEDLYQEINYISQEAIIFDGTLKENIAFNEDICNDDLINALKKVELYPLYKTLPNGLQSALGEKGTRLSGGEKQRVALARLWINKASIIILDESTSAIDNLTEEVIIKHLLNDMKDQTIISIAHRLTSIVDFDRIIVLKDGEILEEGTFKYLIEHSTYFKELYKENTGDEMVGI